MRVLVLSISDASIPQRLFVVNQPTKFRFVTTLSYLDEGPSNMR